MSSRTQIQFRAPEQLIDHVDLLATIEDRNRTDLLIDTLRSYLDEAIENEAVKRDVTSNYFEDSIEYADVKALLGSKEAENLRILKQQLEDDDLTEEIANL